MAPDAGKQGVREPGGEYPTPAATETFTAAATDFAVPDTKAAERELLATFFLLPKGEGSTFSITYTTPGETSTGAEIMQTISLTGQPAALARPMDTGGFRQLHHRHREEANHRDGHHPTHMDGWR